MRNNVMHIFHLTREYGQSYKIAVVGLFCLIFLFVLSGHALSNGTPASLDNLWDKHMLEGTPALYFNGQKREKPKPFPVNDPMGSIIRAYMGEYGIVVQELREQKLFGLLKGGGWIISGGLVDRIENDKSTIELYGKQIVKYYPGLLNNYYYKKEIRYEFYLLNRSSLTKQAVVLKKWVIQPEQIRWIPEDKSKEISDIRTYLTYKSQIGVVEIKITGLIKPFLEQIKVNYR